MRGIRSENNPPDRKGTLHDSEEDIAVTVSLRAGDRGDEISYNWAL